jgi:hypothetical protein
LQKTQEKLRKNSGKTQEKLRKNSGKTQKLPLNNPDERQAKPENKSTRKTNIVCEVKPPLKIQYSTAEGRL